MKQSMEHINEKKRKITLAARSDIQ